MQRDQSAYPGVTGEEPKASTPFQSLALQASQSGSIFNKRRDQDGFDILEVLIDWVITFTIKQINKNHTLTASYSSAELQQLDQAIIADHANHSAKEAILSVDASGPLHQPLIPSPISKEIFASQKQQELSQRGNKRDLYIPKGYITLAKVKQKIRFNITDEMQDSQRELNGLASTLQSLAPTDPERTGIIQRMMELSGSSPASHPIGAAAPAPTATPTPAAPSLAVYYTRGPVHFTSADTTKEPGFNSLYHELIPYIVSLDKVLISIPTLAPGYERKILRLEDALQKDYAYRGPGRPRFFAARRSAV